MLHSTDSTLVQNFEVNFQEETEVRMLGGVKGLRALKQQREELEKLMAKEVDLKPMDDLHNKFEAFSVDKKSGEKVHDEETKEETKERNYY